MYHSHYFFLTKISIHFGSSYMPVWTRVFCNRRVCEQFRICWFHSSVCPNRNNPRTKQVAVFIGHLTRNTDLVAVEVVGFLFAFAFGIGVVAYLRQGFVGILVGVEIGISAVRLDFLQQMTAVPNEAGFFFEAV